MSLRVDVAIVGSGFAGSILARVLARQGLRVALFEAARHPRFALGESSTPLAALSLERLARRWELPDLATLAAWGRWRRELPGLGCGLKRGFSFYRHHPERPFDPAARPGDRLLVAASPSDAIADAHWLRADVDAHLFARAAAEGVRTFEETRVAAIHGTPSGLTLELSGARAGGDRIECSLAVDATGPAAAVARRLGAQDGPRLVTRSGLVYSHFRGALPWAGAAGEGPDETPYPEERAAVHHLLEEGWAYALRFDDGLMSAGLLLEGGAPAAADPATLWSSVLTRYPTLRLQLGSAVPVRPLAHVPSLQRRLDRAAGPHWAALPHTYGFVDPLFSTGLAWSLLGVERLAEILDAEGPESPAIADGSAFTAYADLLGHELGQVDALVAGAYAARSRFSLFVDHSMLYFALVSFAEAEQRLCEPARPAWKGFLRATEPAWRRTLRTAFARLRALPADAGGPALDAHSRWIARAIAPIDVAGLCRPDGRSYGVDPEALVASAAKLGLTADGVRAALPRLRGASEEAS
ncbi:MAG: FAD-dependent oxidoreductase [Thermoanaerobaculia bacterium]